MQLSVLISDLVNYYVNTIVKQSTLKFKTLLFLCPWYSKLTGSCNEKSNEWTADLDWPQLQRLFHFMSAPTCWFKIPSWKYNSYMELFFLWWITRSQERKPTHADTFQSSTCVITASIPLSKPSHMAKPKLSRGRMYIPPTLWPQQKDESVNLLLGVIKQRANN